MGPSLLNGTSSASRTDLAPAASDSSAGEKGRPSVDKAMPAVDDKTMPAVDDKAMPAVDDKAMPAMGERRAVKRNVAPWRKQQHTGEEGTAAVEAAATAEDIYEFLGRYRYLRVRNSSVVDPHHVDVILMRFRVQILSSKERHKPLKKC
jgi:hypothetical protein